MARRVTREEGILVGGSSGAAVVAALRVAEELNDPKSLLSEAYLSVRSSLAFSTDHGVPRSIMMVASAPNFPYGTVDPIRDIGKRALERGLWLHVDACVGGFLAPFARKLGYAIPDFDFGVPDAVRLEYRLSGGVTWLPLSVPQGASQLYWNPKSNTLVEVRLNARDRAGNIGAGTTTVSLTGAGGVYLPPGNDTRPAIAAQSDTELNKLGVEQRRFVNTKRVTMNCELHEVGPSGVALVELWYTHDARSWNRGPEYRLVPGDDKDKHTITFDVASEGVYGITLLARSGVGLGDRPPQVGDRPHLWIEADWTKPEVKLHNVVVGTGADKGKLTVAWEARDKNLPREPITLSYGRAADGPWQPIATKLANSGRYVWMLPSENVPYQFHVKVEAVDRAGNIGEAITPELVKVDLSTPKVRILDIEPSKSP